MKNTSFMLVLILTLVYSCQPSPEKQARKVIHDYLKVNLNNWKSYESLEFGTLDSLFSKMEDELWYSQISEKSGKWLIKVREAEEYIKNGLRGYRLDLLEEATQAGDSLQKYLPIIDSLAKNFKSQHIGWRMFHSYRANNSLNAPMLNKDTFLINLPIDSIIKVTPQNILN